MLEAIVAGVIAQVLGSLIAALLQRKLHPSSSIIEYVPGSERVTVKHSVIRAGPIAFERTTTETRIQGATFRVPDPSESVSYRILPFAVGLASAFVVFVAALLL